MTEKIITVLFQFIIFQWYVTYIKNRFGILDSISKSFYKLPVTERWKFSLFTFCISLPTLVFFAKETEQIKWILGIGCAMIPFVGIFAQFRQKYIDIVHIICASGGIGLVLIGLGISYEIWSILVCFIIGTFFILFTSSKHKTWYIEILAFYLINAGLVIQILKQYI